LESLEYSMGCFLLEEEYDCGAPGRSGVWLKLELEASKKESSLKTMEQLLSSLEKYWKEHHLPEVD